MCSVVSLCVPAGGAVARYDLAQASVHAVIRLQVTRALTRQAVDDAVARIAQTLRLVGPTVHHAARELVAGQEFAGVRLVS